MASQQVNAGKLKSTGTNLTNLASKMKSEMNKLTCCAISNKTFKNL